MGIGFKSLKSDPCVLIYLKGGIVTILILDIDDVFLLRENLKVLGQVKQKIMSCFLMTNTRGVSLRFEMRVTCGPTIETVPITQDARTKFLVTRYGMASCSPKYTPGVEKELSPDQPEEKLANNGDRQCFRSSRAL